LRPAPSSRADARPEPARLGLSAPAKLNLGLRVLGRRPDGYHLLESLFVPIDLADDVAVEVERGGPPMAAADVAIELCLRAAGDAPGAALVDAVPDDARNLVVIAARAFLERAGADLAVRRVRIRLAKRIPAGAGLGGGSSDAGAVLRALSQLVPEGPQPPELSRVALEVGADVPFFLDPRPAMVTGIGDEVTPADDVPPLSLLLVNPGQAIATAEVYALYDSITDEGRGPAGIPFRPTLGSDASRDGLARLQASGNDLDEAAARLCPAITTLRNRLHELGASRVGMSGSGATLYGVFASENEAIGALERAGFEPPVWARVARTLG
jgi:4-diphosphocytidyl-2-C-methyl-D-erythritol kinase